jgi:hypothetical protein
LISKAPVCPHEVATAGVESVDDADVDSKDADTWVGAAVDSMVTVTRDIDDKMTLASFGGADEPPLAEDSITYWLGVTGEESAYVYENQVI